MSYRLCISSDYNDIQLALCRAEEIVQKVSIDKKSASRELIPAIRNILEAHALKLSELSYIGVNGGPAPYTSLRITLATANGLHAATGIPLVLIDAMQAFLMPNQPQRPGDATIILFNAFNNDLFFCVQTYGTQAATGSLKRELFLERYGQLFKTHTVKPLGNGWHLVQEIDPNIAQSLPHAIQEYPTQQELFSYAEHEWQQHHTVSTACALYLKQI